MAAAKSRSAMPPDGVDLVHKHYAWSVALSLIEQVSNATGPNTDKHFNKLRAGDGEERNTRLSRNGASHQGFACAWGSDQQHAFGDLGSQRQKTLRELEELNDLLKLLFSLSDSRNVVEADRWAVAHSHPSPTFAETEGLVRATLRLAHHEQQHGAKEDQRQEVEQNADDAGKAT